jgi:hypothetical protein
MQTARELTTPLGVGRAPSSIVGLYVDGTGRTYSLVAMGAPIRFEAATECTGTFAAGNTTLGATVANAHDLFGETQIHGTNTQSFFNYAGDGSEDTYLRGGKTASKVVLGDVNTGGVKIASTKIGAFGTEPIAKPTGVAVTAAAIHAALVSLGWIAA